MLKANRRNPIETILEFVRRRRGPATRCLTALFAAALLFAAAPAPAQNEESRPPDGPSRPEAPGGPEPSGDPGGAPSGRGDAGGAPSGGGGQGPPPAAVTVAEVVEGVLSPDAEFLGTVYFTDVSEVAAEVSGKVVEADFEEGQHLAKGDVLVRLDAELPEKSLAALEAGLAQTEVQLEEAGVNYEREKSLFKQTVGVERNYDQARFQVQILTNKVAQQQAEIARLRAEIRKHEIRMPFDGVVLKQHAEPGEWLNPGGLVAVVAIERQVDVIVNLPERVLPFLEKDARISVAVNGRTVEGRLFAVVPQGEVATRTFPVKIRIESVEGIYEGMEARVRLPVDEVQKCLLVVRDAIIPLRGQDTVFTVSPDNTAVPNAVRVVGFRGPMAGVEAKSLQAGAMAITKGQERLRPGQAVTVLRGQPDGSPGGPMAGAGPPGSESSDEAPRDENRQDASGGSSMGRRP